MHIFHRALDGLLLLLGVLIYVGTEHPFLLLEDVEHAAIVRVYLHVVPFL